MTSDQIQQWAREAELAEPSDTWESLPASYTAALETFATLARADLEAERDAWHQAHDEQVDLLNKIASERDQLRADAMRYRWLRESDAEHARVMTYIEGLDEWLGYATAEDIDAAVDQKMKETK